LTDSPPQDGPAPAFNVSLFALWRDPLVCVSYLRPTSKTAFGVIAAIAKGKPFHILAPPQWRMSDQLNEALELKAWLASEHPQATLTIMTATQADAAMVTAAGLNAIWASHTALVDERAFYVEPDVEKIYDAAHTANSRAWKRHDLAYGVPNLALVTYSWDGGGLSYDELIGNYKSLDYINYSERDGPRNLDPSGVRGVLGRARCGLVLSALEGANNASMEYFLCGLPLVTTPSEGGREEMYDPRHVTIVEPTAEAVEAAVAAYRSRAPDPFEIRASALAKARAHRARLLAWLSEVVGRNLAPMADGNLWLPQFRNKLSAFWWVQPRPDGGINAWPT
jgi:hypothetical protein